MSTATLTSTAPRRRGFAAARAVVNRMTLPVLLLLPAIVIVGGLVGYPLARTIYLSFTDTDLGGLIYGGSEFTGIENFKEVFTDDRLRVSAGAGVRWNDPAFSIRWPEAARVIAERDRVYPDFRPESVLPPGGIIPAVGVDQPWSS